MGPNQTSTTARSGARSEEHTHQHLPAECVDLIYLDPPFKSDAQYNVLFQTHDGSKSQAQIHAFDDTWHWNQQADEEYDALTTGPAPIEVATFIQAMRRVLGTSDMMAYLVMMAPRLIELRRVMKPTASIYLHCDPTSSHYLKLLMDSVFGAASFQNEIVWYYSHGGKGKTRFARKHDIILFYTRSKSYYFNGAAVAEPLTPHKSSKSGKNYGGRMGVDEDGREYTEKWGTGKKKLYRYYLDEGKIPEDVWLLQSLQSQDKERLGYPTQKPLGLLDRIIRASCPPDGIVLDPFCGCGTTVDAAQSIGNAWIGIDITYIAIDLIIKRLQHRYGDEILATFTTNGIPQDAEGADALFAAQPVRL